MRKKFWLLAAFVVIVGANVMWAMKWTLPPLDPLTGSSIVVRKISETGGRVRAKSDARNDWVTADFYLPQTPHGWFGIVELRVDGKTEQAKTFIGPLAGGLQPTTISYRVTDEYDRIVGGLAKERGLNLSAEKTTFVAEMVVKNHFPGGTNYSAGYSIGLGPRYVFSVPFERSAPSISMGWGSLSNQTVPVDTKIVLDERFAEDMTKSPLPVVGGWSDDREEMLRQRGAHTIFLYIRFERAEKLFPKQYPQTMP